MRRGRWREPVPGRGGAPNRLCRAQEGAGGESEVDLGDLVVGEGADLGGLRVGQTGGGVEHVVGGALADIELSLLGLQGAGVEDDALACGEDSLPGAVDGVGGVENFESDGLFAGFFGGQPLDAREDGFAQS